MARPPPSIAATSTLAMVRTAEARGIPTADLLERAGLSRSFLEDPDSRIPGVTVLSLWNALRERAADPVIQLAAPGTLPFGAYRIIDYLVAASVTVGDGIRRFAGFFRLIADAVVLDIEEAADEFRLVIALASGDPVPPIYVDYVFAALVTRMRMRIRRELRVLRVELRQPEPPGRAAHLALFLAPVHFGALGDRLCFSREEWAAPTDSGDSALASLLEQHARMLTERVPRTLSPFERDVQRAIASTLPEGGSAASVARTLHVSVRTLQRKLVAAGTSFSELSESVRARLAEEYLTNPAVSIGEVAYLLGFSDQSSFNRAFRRWTGEPPGQWRRQHVGAIARVHGGRA